MFLFRLRALVWGRGLGTRRQARKANYSAQQRAYKNCHSIGYTVLSDDCEQPSTGHRLAIDCRMLALTVGRLVNQQKPTSEELSAFLSQLLHSCHTRSVRAFVTQCPQGSHWVPPARVSADPCDLSAAGMVMPIALQDGQCGGLEVVGMQVRGIPTTSRPPPCILSPQPLGGKKIALRGGGGVTRKPIFPTPPPSLAAVTGGGSSGRGCPTCRAGGGGGATQHLWLKMIPTSR